MDASQSADLRPLSVGEILDVAIKIYMRHAWVLLGIVVLVVAPIQVLASLVETSAASAEFVETDPITAETTLDADEFWLAVTGFAVVTLLTAAAATLATAACFKAIADAYLGEPPSRAGSIAFALRRFHSVVWVTVFGIVLATLGLLLCIVPGVWLYVSFAVAVPVLLTEGLKGRRALGRSRRLVKGRWWPAFAVVVVGTILAGLVTAVVEALLAVVSLADPENEVLGFLASAVGGTISSTITTPFAAAFIVVLYFDLRVRKEGFDLELLAERLGLTARPGRTVLAERAPPPLPPPADGEQPPYWPPPPGWRPSSDRPPE